MAQEFNPYVDATYFNHPVVGNPYAIKDGFTGEELTRVNTELLLWRIYKGQHWPWQRKVGEPQVTINYSRAFVDKGIAFLMGKGFNITTKPDAEKVTKSILDEVWDDNNRSLVALDMAQAGGVTGNTWVKVAVETFDPEKEPDRYETYPNGRIRILVLPTYSVFPTWHPHDRDRMIRCRIIYPVLVESTDANDVPMVKQLWYREEITPERIREYLNDELIDDRENALKEITVVRVKNLPLAGEPYGVSDLQDIVPLQLELNRKATDVSDIINYHAAPITIIKGAKATGLEKGARKIWGGLPEKSDVFNLELKSDLTAANNYMEVLKTAMFELAHMPEDAFGKKTNVSNTSGVALHIKNQPLMEITRTKWTTYGEGIKQINRLILKYAQLLEYPGFSQEAFLALKPAERYWTDVQFADPLPKDDLIQMQLIAQKISLMLMTRKDALIELGETEAAEKLDEIIAESKKLQDVIYPDVGAETAKQTNIGGIVEKREKVEPDGKGKSDD